MINEEKHEELINACIDGDFKKVQRSLKNDLNVNYVNKYYKDTALSQSALKGHINIVDILLEKSNQYSKDLALIFASQSGHVEIMQKLIDNGANINNSFDRYPAAIYQVIMHDKKPAFDYLIQCENIDLMLPFDDSFPILMAAYNNRLDMVKALVEKGVSPNVLNDKNLGICDYAKDKPDILLYMEELSRSSSLSM